MVLDDLLPGPPGAGGPSSFRGDGPVGRIGRVLIGRALGIIPSLDDEVAVEVTGQPGTTKQQLYFTALATANGMVRRFGDLFSVLVPAYGSLTIEYDAANHWVRCTIGYRWSMAAANADVDVPVASQFNRMAVYRGPQCDVVGGDFDFLATGPGVIVPPGIPLSAVSPEAPNLPLDGQPILTACPVTQTPQPRAITQSPAPSVPVVGAGGPILSPNPKPPGDNRSRGSVIVPEFGPGSVLGARPLPGPNPIASSAKCCDKLRALIPLVYSALSEPATTAGMIYPSPDLGIVGV